MIYSHRSLFALILGIVLLSGFGGYAHAHQDPTAADKEEAAALREKAFKLLESVATQLNTLQSSENRARMGANLADSLWKRDAERARSLLRVVQEDIKTELQQRDRKLDQQRFNVFFKLRYDTVERIAKYDAEAAFEFLKVTEPLFGEQVPHEYRGSEHSIELRLAKQIAASNPDVALKLGRQALERGFSSDLLMLLVKLNRKHKEQGQILYKETVVKLRDADLEDNWNARNFAQLLIPGIRPPDADESIFRELVSILVTKALALGCERKASQNEEENYRMASFCRWAAASIRGAESYDSRAVRLKHWSNDEYPAGLGFAFEQVQELLDDGAFEELEAVASKHPELEGMVYQQLVQKLVFSGDLDRARKLVTRLPSDSEIKPQLLAHLEAMENRAAITEEKLADIQRKLPELPHLHERVRFLLDHANLFGTTDRQVAMKLLNQAGEIIDAMPPGMGQTENRIRLAIMYCSEKSDRGFSMMEVLIPKLNELVELAVKLDGYDTNYLRDGEWNMSGNGSVGKLLTRLSADAARFAWSDFDRAVSMASQFDRPEIRMMAHLKLAQGILAGPPQRYAR